MTVPNGNWPVIDHAIAWHAGPPAPTFTPPLPAVTLPGQSLWTSLLDRARKEVNVRRGRQYELDQVQPGECALTLRNDDGHLAPQNSASPFYPRVTPFRAHRVRAQWPPTQNLADLVAWTGSQQTIAAGVVLGAPGVAGATVTFGGWSLPLGVPCSYQVQVYPLAGSPGLTVQLLVTFYDVNGLPLLGASGPGTPVTSAGTAVQLQLQNVTPPAAAVGSLLVVLAGNSGSTAYSYVAQHVQVETGTVCTAGTQPGTWYPLHTGYVERWPQKWLYGGNYGVVETTSIDVFGVLSQQRLKPTFIADLLALGPNFLYRMDDTGVTFANATGNQYPLTLVNSNFSPGVFSAGNSVPTTPTPLPGTALTDLQFTNTFLGAPGSVVTMAPASGQPQSWTAPRFNPQPGTLPGPTPGQAFTRIIAFQSTGTGQQAVWTTTIPGSGFIWAVLIVPGTPVGSHTPNQIHVLTGTGGDVPVTGVDTTDGGWHLLMTSVSADGLSLSIAVDDVFRYDVTFSAPAFSFFIPTTLQEFLGAAAATQYAVLSPGGLQGSIGTVVELPTYTTSTSQTWKNLYASWRRAYGGRVAADLATATPDTSESSGSRYRRLLGWSQFGGQVVADRGDTVLYGPAADLQAAPSSAPDVVTSLQAVVDTEGGFHYVSAGGVPTLRGRAARNPLQTPVVVFGENVAAGEVPYLDDVALDFDATHLVNDAQITQTLGGAVFSASDPPSQATFGETSLSRSVNTLDGNEAAAAAGYFVAAEKNPRLRVASLTVDVGAMPWAWPLLLPLELGARVRLNRRPTGAPMITVDGWVEQLQWTITEDLRATLKVAISPVLPYTSAMAAATQLTLSLPALAGSQLLQMAPLPDAAVNVLVSDVSAAPGAIWYVEPGTARQEAFVLLSISVSPGVGYASFAMLTTSVLNPAGGAPFPTFQYTHPGGALVTDTLTVPASTWDGSAAADSVSAGY